MDGKKENLLKGNINMKTIYKILDKIGDKFNEWDKKDKLNDYLVFIFGLFILFDIALFIGVAYVVYHFISKYW